MNVISLIVMAAILLTKLNVAFATPASCATVDPIAFGRNGSEATASGAVARGELHCYSLTARESQAANILVTSIEGNAVFQLYRPGWALSRNDDGLEVNGQPYSRAAEGDDAQKWSGPFTASGPQLLVVGSTKGGATYRLHVAVAP